jgi:hypothetical protein
MYAGLAWPRQGRAWLAQGRATALPGPSCGGAGAAEAYGLPACPEAASRGQPQAASILFFIILFFYIIF